MVLTRSQEEARKKLLKDAGLYREPNVLERAVTSTERNRSDSTKISKASSTGPTAQEKAARLQESEPTAPELLIDKTTKKIQGVRLPGKGTFFADPKEVSGLIENFYSKNPNAPPLQDAELEGLKRATLRAGQEFLSTQQPINQPLRPDLVPDSFKGIEGTPIVGPSLAALVQAKMKGFGMGFSNRQFIEFQLRNEAFGMIENRLIEDDFTLAELFGVALEAIPLQVVPFTIGSSAQAGAKVSTTIPRDIVNTALTNIEAHRSNALRLGRMVRRGTIDPRLAYTQILDSQNRIQDLENRIALATSYSASLRGNPDQVHLIEDKILAAKIGITDAANSAKEVILGGNITPDQVKNEDLVETLDEMGILEDFSEEFGLE